MKDLTLKKYTMSKNPFYVAFIFLLVVGFFSCLKQDNPLASEKPPSKVSIIHPPRGAVFQFGDTLLIEATIDDDIFVANSAIFINGNLIESQLSSYFPVKFYQGIFYRPGKSVIRVEAHSVSGDLYSDSVTVSIEAKDIPYYDAEILNIYDHDEDAFTQGLVYEDGILYESTGLYGESTLRKTGLETGTVLQIRYLNNAYFAEGLTTWQNSLIQLTWQEQKGFVYNKSDFDSLRSFSYQTEGWGLTHDGSRLLMSDGSSSVYFLNPNSFQVISSFPVSARGQPVFYLNELEYIDGDLFANIWRTPYIARIDIQKREVIAWIDLEQVSQENTRGVLNGIAYDVDSNRLFITGKRWSRLYEICLIPRQQIPNSAQILYARN